MGEELGHAQRTLGNFRQRVDEHLARVVHQDVQGEGVAKVPFGTASSDPYLYAGRCWPEVGWPDQLEEKS